MIDQSETEALCDDEHGEYDCFIIHISIHKMLMKMKVIVCGSCHIPVKVRYVISIHLVCIQLIQVPEPLRPLLADL